MVSEDLIICVNVSSHEVMGDGFVDNVRSALTHSGLEPGRLEIELNDVVLAEKPDVAWARLKSLREMGVRIAVDGFGLRQSSFAQLARLPVNTLKIDRAFVRDVVHGHREQAIVDLLLALARGLDLVTVAEQLHYLQGQQCDRLQGSSGAAHARAGAHAGAQGR